MLHRRPVLIAAAAIVGLGAATSATSPGDAPAPPPPWVDEDGTVDLSEVPARLPVSGPDGEVVGYIDSAALFAPPPLAPEEPAEAASRRSGRRPVEPNDEAGGIQQEAPTEPLSERSLQPSP